MMYVSANEKAVSLNLHRYNSEDNFHIKHRVDRLPSKKDLAAKGVSRVDTGARRTFK
jgi:hypothetical protein